MSRSLQAYISFVQNNFENHFHQNGHMIYLKYVENNQSLIPDQSIDMNTH